MDDIGARDSTQDNPGSEDQEPRRDRDEGGHSGEGAASALAHMKSQVKQHRALSGEPDDAAGGSGGHGQ